jgi:uncharacterized protein YecE (DUF72 family)
MGWSYNFWKSNFYPENLDSSEFLSFYSSKFDTVEVDNTFYRIPREQTVLEWKRQTSKNFVFSLKFPRIITHIKMLKDCETETRVFLERVALLEEKLGPLLLQFPYTFGAEYLSRLENFLETLPKNHRYAIEVRNNKLLNDDLYAMLKKHNVALVWVDSASMPLVTEETSNFVYIRFEGDRKKVKGTLGKTEKEKTIEIGQWLEKLRPYIKKGIAVFGYFSKYYSGFPPNDIQKIQEFLNDSKSKRHPENSS